MNKYEILEGKLNNILKYIDNMKIEDKETREYLLNNYRKYVEDVADDVKNMTIVNSDGGVLGLIRGISDYSELCADRKLKQLICDAEDYYKYDCYRF